MSLLRTFLVINIFILSNATNSEELDEIFFKNFQKNYCLNNEYNCKFDGSVSSYSVDDFLGQKYKFVELFFAENNFDSAVFEHCGSRGFNPSVSIENKQNSFLKSGGRGCIRFKYLKDKSVDSLIEERRGLFSNIGDYAQDRSIYSYSSVIPGYVITLSHPDNYYNATGKGLNNLGVHFFIDLMDKNNIDEYCTNKTSNNVNQLPSSLKKLVNNSNINLTIESLKKNYYIFYRLYLKDIANFKPSKFTSLTAECGFIRKNASSTKKMYIFVGKNIENKSITKGEKI
tara:strand:+ start:341 stop:1198 length:858 start_codon:yes stop_codon:yes gene_type:complete